MRTKSITVQYIYIYIADLDNELAKKNIGVTLGNNRLWALAYVDDIILLAKNKVALEDMMGTLKKFLKTRKMELSAEKTKRKKRS